MPTPLPAVEINLLGVIVAVTNEVPRVLVVERDGKFALPNGPFDAENHASLEDGLTQLIEAQTGLDLYYVEQLYTFGNRNRDPEEIHNGRRVISVAYIALTREDEVAGDAVHWADWYQFLPWEDWRAGRPTLIESLISPGLQHWVRRASGAHRRKAREDRCNVTFGDRSAVEMDAVLSLDRFELLYEAQLITEAHRDAAILAGNAETPPTVEALGVAMQFDHRRVLATALGRLRGKLAYRPVVFELLAGEFTLLQLQRVAEALSGARMHKQNFRRLVLNADLVEPVGRTNAIGRGRPAELFRFRREVLGEKLTVGLSRPILRIEP